MTLPSLALGDAGSSVGNAQVGVGAVVRSGVVQMGGGSRLGSTAALGRKRAGAADLRGDAVGDAEMRPGRTGRALAPGHLSFGAAKVFSLGVVNELIQTVPPVGLPSHEPE